MEDFAVLFEFWKEGEGNEEEVKAAYQSALAAIEEAEFKSTLNEPEDELPAAFPPSPGSRYHRRRN